ncbi:MAG TPA: hypothetical protein VMT55_06230, partial [Candidatus Sulfotelmatobacter sp.]|nr:hypothetical protein [Candidatus Sulfotelmatobacter sp.]
ASAEGMTHLSVMTGAPVPLSLASPANLNISDSAAAPVALYKDNTVTNALDSFRSLTTTTASPKTYRVIRNGNLDGNKGILATDFTATWISLFNIWKSGPITADNPFLPFAIADCDGNGNITAADFTADWISEYNDAKKAGTPHVYVPDIK